MESSIEFYIGTYSQGLGNSSARGEGIHAASIDLETGELVHMGCSARCANPSYLAWGPGRKVLYATREVAALDGPAIVSFDEIERGQLQLRQTIPLQGGLPCHVAIDVSGRFLTSAQYGSGDIALFRLDQDGEVIDPAQVITHSGKGVDPERQEGPHAHYAAVLSPPDVLIAVDLGLDAVLAYDIDPTNGQASSSPAFTFQTAGGAGPRHLAVMPGSDTAYLYCELNDEIYQLTLDASGCECAGTLQAFAHSKMDGSAGAAIKIAPDQRHLYVSGRTQSQIAAFEIDRESRRLTALACVDTGGISPRDFSITPDGSFLVIANETSDSVTSLRRDKVTGLLEPTGCSIEVGSPVCILF